MNGPCDAAFDPNLIDNCFPKTIKHMFDIYPPFISVCGLRHSIISHRPVDGIRPSTPWQQSPIKMGEVCASMTDTQVLKGGYCPITGGARIISYHSGFVVLVPAIVKGSGSVHVGTTMLRRACMRSP